MNKLNTFKFTLSAVAFAVLVGCGGNDGATTTPSTPPPAVACAPLEEADIASNNNFSSICVPGTAAGSSRRYDMYMYTDGFVNFSEVNFAASTSCSGTNTMVANLYTYLSISGTTTVAALGADGVTPVTGSARVASIDAGESVEMNGTFTGSNPFTTRTSSFENATTTTIALCKRAPSTTASRTIDQPRGSNNTPTFTPTFALSVSLPNSTSINTGFALDGVYSYD